MSRPVTEMVVEMVRMDLPDTKTVRLKWPAGYEIEFKTGQFIVLHWPDRPDHRRAYSLSSCALERGYFDITVKREGVMGTRVADSAQPGDRLMVAPPTGLFQPVFKPDHHLICIAGGSGVTPYRAFVREATLRKLQTRITILYSVRTTKDILFNEELRQLERENRRFQFHVTCTRAAENGPWEGLRGRIDAELVKSLVLDPATSVFYACGPTAFVEAAEKMVVNELRFPRVQFKAEKWGAMKE
jgi:ferredoxin-NADP reductase